MAARTIEVPSFDFSVFYYPQILESLIIRKRIDVPELTDESDFEPFIQLLRSFALVGHLNNVLLDVVANESTLPTAQLVETVRNMLSLIDYDLASASPATVELLFELSTVFVTLTEVLPEAAQVATRVQGDSPVIFFETSLGYNVSPTNQFGAVLAEDGGVFTEYTTQANTAVNFTPWATPASGDSLYFGHDSAMWDTMDIDVFTPAANIVGIWEFYDGDLYDVQPTAVVNIGGGNLEVDLTSLLGVADRRGTIVQVSLNETGTAQTVTSTWDGSKNIATIGLLGQTSPSVDAADYTVGTAWTEFASTELAFDDGTVGLTQDGEVTYTLPQTELQNWKETTINGLECFWVRFRIITVSTPTSPTLALCRMDTGKQYVIASATQGRSVSDDPLGSSNGAPNQTFTTTRDHFIDGSEEFRVDGEVWVRVRNFLSSGPQDKHYTVSLGENDRATFKTGDGVTGRIPPVGQGNIAVDYRFNAEENGNVGANTVVVDKTGLTYVNSVTNPRQAGGWAEAEGASTESLERAKLAGPASLRTKDVALNGDDAITLARAFVAADGSRPFSRATYVEEGFGPKTLELILVGSGGVTPTVGHLAEIELYFNGDKFASPPVEKHFVANQEVVAVSFDARTINVTAVVRAPETVTVAQIVNGLSQVIQPEALKEDGVTFEWDFGDRVPISRLVHEIFKVDEAIEDVDISVPALDIQLGSRELPVAGTFTITIIET